MCSKILHTLLVSFFEFHNYLQQCKRSSLLSWRWKEIPILILIYTSQQPNYSIYTSTWLPQTFYQRKLLILCIFQSFTLLLRDQVKIGVKTGIIVILPQVQVVCHKYNMSFFFTSTRPHCAVQSVCRCLTCFTRMSEEGPWGGQP